MGDNIWRPSKKKYGVAICNYTGTSPQTLSHLHTGEPVHIFEEYGTGSSAWYRGTSLKNKDKMGIFPACLIHIKPCTVDNEGVYETITPIEDPMVKEVAYVLREWSVIWKTLFVEYRLSDPSKNNPLFLSVENGMHELLGFRSLLVDKQLTFEDARDVKKDIVSVIDWGNGQLGMDLVPRIDGEQVEADTCSITQLHRVHVVGAQMAGHDKPHQRRKTKTSKGEMVSESGVNTHHLLTSFINFGCNVGDSSETLLALYQYKDGKIVCITEKFAVKNSKLLVPEDIEKINNYYGLFTDLTSEDLEKDLFLVAHIYRVGKMVPENSKKAPHVSYKRPWGVGVKQLESELTRLNLARLPANFKEWEFQMKVTFCDREQGFPTLHESMIRQIIQGSSPSSSAAKQGQNLKVSTRILHGDLATVRKEDPMLFSKGVAIVQKLGHSDVITPGEVRNDLYITLVSGEFERGSKKSQKNVEVKVTVYDSNDKIINNCITYGCGEEPQSQYFTSVFYHNNRPEWNETIRLSVPIDIFPGSHVCFELFHCSVSTKDVKKPFGLAYFKVTNKEQIVLQDGEHDLCIYKYDEKHKLKVKDYLTLPFLKNDLNDPHRFNQIPSNLTMKSNEMETLTISTLLCSGKFTQNSDLLGILNWRGEQFQNQLSENLTKLRRMQGEEIVKFLHDVLDSLFDMFSEEAVIKTHSQEIFESMVHIFTLIHHARFETFKPVLEAYITDTFAAPLVHKPLCSCFAEMLRNGCKPDQKTNLRLIQAFSTVDYIFKFIVQSRQLQMKNVFSRGSGDAKEFEQNLRSLFDDMANLLISSPDSLKPYQMALLSNLNLCYTPLLLVLSTSDMVQLICSCLEDMPGPSKVPEDITKAKLELLRKTVDTKLFTADDSRHQLLPLALEQVKECMRCRKQVNLAVELLGDIMDCIFKLRQNDNIREDIQTILSSIFDVVMETVLDLSDRSRTKQPTPRRIRKFGVSRRESKVPNKDTKVGRSRSCVTLNSGAKPVVRVKTISESRSDYQNSSVIFESYSGSNPTINIMEHIEERDTLERNSTVFQKQETMDDFMLEKCRQADTSGLKAVHSFLDIFGRDKYRKGSRDRDLLSPDNGTRSRSRSPCPDSERNSPCSTWQKDKVNNNGALIACLTEMLRLMDEEHYDALLHIYHRGEPLKGFLINILTVFKLLVQPNIFPKDWSMMRMVTSNVVFTAIEYFSQALKDNYMAGDKFNPELWSSYFNLAVAFIIQPSLQLDRYSEAKAQKLKDRYQDMRVLMGVQVQTLWQSLGEHKQHFIPGMIGQFLEITLVPERELRKATLHILYDMMDTEHRLKGHFKQVEATLIERLDYFLTQQHTGDTEYKDLFKQILLERVQSEPSLQENGTQFIISVTHLLERLLDYRAACPSCRPNLFLCNVRGFCCSLNWSACLTERSSESRRPSSRDRCRQVVDGEENKDKRMHCTFNILNFYKDEINREEMYIRYVNKLHDLHMVANNHTEAGLTLQLYAKILTWSERILPAEMRYRQERECDRREMLYTQIINCFDKGKVWEYALPLCKDLAEYYEKNLDYKKLGDILKQQASFYQKILEGEPSNDPANPDTFIPRQDPAYYRVSYYGQSFPSYVRNKQFIYRGDECLRLETIINHLTAEFPAAQVIPNTSQNEAIKDGDQQFIQICSVKTIPADRPDFKGKEVPLEIKNFYNVNEVDTFQFDRPYHRGKKNPDLECKSLCIERTKMRTAYRFPGILRWYEVVSMETEHLCPIRYAVESMRQANTDLHTLVCRCQANSKLYFGQLGMKLQGMIQAAVNGGISKFHEAFFTKDFETEHRDEVMYLEELQTLLEEQVKILSRGMILHGQLVTPDLVPLHKTLDEELKKIRKSVSDHSSPHVSVRSSNSSLARPGSPSSQTSSEESGRYSFISQDGDTGSFTEEHPYKLTTSDKSRRSLLEGTVMPPPVPERPRSMYNADQASQGQSPMKPHKSDPSLTEGQQSPASVRGLSVSAGGYRQSGNVRVSRHNTTVATPTQPPLPQKRRPSEHERWTQAKSPNIYPNTQASVTEPDGRPPEVPKKNTKRSTIFESSAESNVRPSTLAAAKLSSTVGAAPPPALPPRKPSMVVNSPPPISPHRLAASANEASFPGIPTRSSPSQTSVNNGLERESVLQQQPQAGAQHSLKSVPPIPMRKDNKKVPPIPEPKPSPKNHNVDHSTDL